MFKGEISMFGRLHDYIDSLVMGLVFCSENQGAAAVHFQDFNVEVLRCLTLPNVKANLQKRLTETENDVSMPEVRFFAGDWTEVYQLFGCGNDSNLASDPNFGYDIILMAETVYSLSSLQGLYELIKKVMFLPGYMTIFFINDVFVRLNIVS